jgi:beta-lactamase class A
MRKTVVLAMVLGTTMLHAGRDLEALDQAIRQATAGQATTYGIVYQRLDKQEHLALNESDMMHAASTMKVPVMMRLFEMIQAGELELDQPIVVKNRFTSIFDGSHYEIDVDSDQELYDQVGKKIPLKKLMELMIVRSSNLATNILVELADAPSIMNLMDRINARPIKVLRGVQDLKAYEAGMSNRCSAQAMATVMAAVADSAIFSDESRKTMLAILRGQEFTDMIPDGIPPEANAVTANKTGSISTVQHDAAYVELPGGVRYVLIVFARDFADEKEREKVKATARHVSRLVYSHASANK